MAADFSIKQGDTEPVFAEKLIDSTGAAVNLEGASVSIVIRSMTSPAPLTVTGSASVSDPVNGQVQWAPSAQDTATAGTFMANWVIRYGNGAVQTYPTEGYIWITIEENLSTIGGQQLVSLPDVKEYLSVPAEDRTHDEKLIGFIAAAAPVIENITGPVIVREFEEWHDGGNTWIQLRRRPSSAIGTSPVLTLVACSEYNGPREWPLAVVPSPDKGQLYSCMLDARRGRVVRRTAGGGVQGFPAGPDSVHVIYQAGQQTIPENVRKATLELIRVNYRTTQPSGHGFASVADLQDQTNPAPIGFLVPGVVRELLSPNRRHPSIA